MLHARAADEIWLAALVNLSAVVGRCAERKRIDLLCAGTGGKITREDVLLAGAIVARLTAPAGDRHRSATAPANSANDSAQRSGGHRAGCLAAGSGGAGRAADRRSCSARQLRQTQGGRNLAALGLEADLADAAAIDRYTIVPRFDPRSGRITPA